MHIYLPVYTYMSENVYIMGIYTCLCVCVFVYVYVWLHAFLHICVPLCVCVDVCVYTCLFECMCTYISMSIYLCMCVCTCTCGCIHSCMHAYMCLCMHVYVHTPVRMSVYPPPIGSSSQENPNRYTSLHFHCLCFQTFLLRIPEEAFFFKTITSGVSFSKCKLDVGKLNLHDPFTEPKIKLLEVPLPLSLCRDSFLCMTLYINCPSCVIGSSVSSSLPDSILPPPTH